MQDTENNNNIKTAHRESVGTKHIYVCVITPKQLFPDEKGWANL